MWKKRVKDLEAIRPFPLVCIRLKIYIFHVYIIMYNVRSRARSVLGPVM